MQIHNCVLSQIHFFLTPSLLELDILDIMISFAPSALCQLIQRIWPLHLTSFFSFPAPSFIQAVPCRPSVTCQARPSKWWLWWEGDVDSGCVCKWSVVWTGRLGSLELVGRCQTAEGKRDTLTRWLDDFLSGRPVDGHCGSGLSPLRCVTPDSRVLSHLAAWRHHLRPCPK